MDSRSPCGLKQDTPSKGARSTEPMNLSGWPGYPLDTPATRAALDERTSHPQGEIDAVRAELGEAGTAFSADTEVFRPIRPEFVGGFCGASGMPLDPEWLLRPRTYRC